MAISRGLCGALLLLTTGTAAADERDIVQSQWLTGPLLAPSPPTPAEGKMAVEPYVLVSREAGADRLVSFTAVQYGLTDNLAVQLLPGFARAPDGAAGVRDLPVRLKYRWFGREDVGFWHPSLTTTAEIVFPLGAYRDLAAPGDAFGSGVYAASGQVLVQSLFTTFGHGNRLRLWGTARAPLDSASLGGISAYGTGPGFQGSALPGASAELGVADEFGLDRHWALALDVVGDFSRPAHLRGVGAPPSGKDSASLILAPAIEYNFADWIGVIAGAQFTASGRNASNEVVPQVAVNMFF